MAECAIIESKEIEKYLREVPWEKFLSYGSVKVQIREGKLTMITVEITKKLD